MAKGTNIVEAILAIFLTIEFGFVIDGIVQQSVCTSAQQNLGLFSVFMNIACIILSISILGWIEITVAILVIIGLIIKFFGS